MANEQIKYSATALDYKAQDDGNQFAIQITPADPRADAWASGDIVVRLSIPYGRPATVGATTFLLPDQAARPKIEYRRPADSEPNTIDLLSNDSPQPPAKNSVCWETDPSGISVDAGDTLRIDVSRLPKMPDGTATVLIGIRRASDHALSEQSVAVKVPPDKSGKPQIHYFVADRDYILHAGEDGVKLDFFTTGANAVTLYKNNVKVWPPLGGSKDLFYQDKPGITSLYRLEARGGTDNAADDRETLLKNGNLVVLSLTVQVAQAGWNRQPLPQGYPTVLMKALDFTSGGSERLYGVFVDPKTNATGLYSSATGFPPWRMEANGQDFKDIQFVADKEYDLLDMSQSPGVASGGKLWLIGGSSVNPSQVSNEVWYYWKNSKTKKEEWVRDNPGPFTPRMGHCVVDFQNKLWVLGGYDKKRAALNDVWSYDLDTNEWSPSDAAAPVKAQWSERCMFAAAATSDANQMWLYGGRTSPNVTTGLTDLWSTTDGRSWQREDTLELGPLPGQPNGATLFWDDGLHLAGSFNARTRVDTNLHPDDADAGATLTAMVYSLCPGRFLWEANPVSWGWEQFGGNPFLMRSIVFNRFWFFWSLFRDIQTAPKLNVFIPS